MSPVASLLMASSLCDPRFYCLIAAVLATSYWLAFKLNCELYLTSKKHDSLYFYSIFISLWAMPFRTLGCRLQVFV